MRLMAVSRLGAAMLPTSDLVLQEADVVYLAVGADQLSDLDSIVAAPQAGQGH